MPPKRKLSDSVIGQSAPVRVTRQRTTAERIGTMVVEPAHTTTRQTRKAMGKSLDTESSTTPLQRTDTFVVTETEAMCSCEEEPASSAKPKRKAKAKGVDVSDPLPRRNESPWKIGAHVSSAGGVENAILNAFAIGATSFALFLKSQRKWESPPLTHESIKQFKKNMSEYGYSATHILPHGSYLINLANPDQTKRQKSYDCFLDDLKRCELLGLELYNFHPGSTLGEPLQSAVENIAQCINDAHAATSSVTIVLENMAGAGNIIGSDFAHLASIIERVNDKNRVGVCIDTCHAFAAGYDIRTQQGWDATMQNFDDVVGLKYLRGMHINDSKTEFNSRRDRHESIGLGYLGLAAFQHIVNDPRTQNIPLVLETPSFEQPRQVWGKEIEVLQRLAGKSSSMTEDDARKPQSEEMESSLQAYVDEIRQAVKIAELNEKKPGGGKPKKVVSKKTKSGEVDGDDDGGDIADEAERAPVVHKGRKARVVKAAPVKKGGRKKKVVEADDEVKSEEENV